MSTLEAPKIIRIRFDKKGNSTTTAEGFKGDACLKATSAFEEALGPQVGPRENTAEMYEVEEQNLELQQGDEQL